MMNNVVILYRRWFRCELGNVSIEFAFIGSLLIMLTLGVFEMGRIAYAYQTLQSAAGIATRMVDMGASDEEIANTIRARFPSREQGSLVVTFAPQVSSGLSYKRINAQITLPLIMPSFGIFPGNVLTVNAVQLVPTS